MLAVYVVFSLLEQLYFPGGTQQPAALSSLVQNLPQLRDLVKDSI
jgi:hypothetical protein